jgi:hypothetical protein
LWTTYGYEPIVFTTSAPSEELTSALLFCGVRSWLTGNRLVSLPFSDYCEPLVEDRDEVRALSHHAKMVGTQEPWNYVELRSINTSLDLVDGFKEYTTYRRHWIDLRPSLDNVYKGFHKDCIRRKIHRAERESLNYEEGRGEALLRHFYRLVVKTRLRKHLPPQPFEWFQNLVTSLGEDLCIRVAFKGEHAVAGILTLNHGTKMYYKYGGSDARFNNLGATPMLFWKAIEAAKMAGMEEFDLGRSELDNRGLIQFKERWSAQGMPLITWRAPSKVVSGSFELLKSRVGKAVCAWFPRPMLPWAGRLLYRHIG